MTIAAHSTTPVPAAPCEQTPKRVLSDDEITVKIGSSHENAVDLTYSSRYDTFEDSTQFFYFSTERPPPPPTPQPEKTEKARKTFSKRQWFVIIDFMICNFCTAACVSLQAPFYPAEAEKKGVTPSEYGFVFGIFELVVFLVSPLYGKYIGHIGHKFLVTAGTFLTSTSCILFGLLHLINNTQAFLFLSFGVRIVEALGQAGYLTGSFTIIAQEFPNNVASMFAMLEAAYGVGLFVGPFIGGTLFEFGGYSFPFLITGTCLLLGTLVTYFILPSQDCSVSTNRLSMMRLFRVPTVALAGYFTFSASFSLGFLVTVLEHHLRVFELSPRETGAFFVISGGLYAVTTPLWGRLCETKLSPMVISGVGAFFMVITYLLVGPAPYMPFRISLLVVIVGLVFHGLGLASELVGSFSLAHKGAVRHGFPDTIETYGLVSGFWTSIFALGAFIGPSAAGILQDAVGFEWGSQLVLLFNLIGMLIVCGTIIFNCNRNYKSDSGLENGDMEEKIPLVY